MHPFLSGLRAALPAAGFWEAPAVVAVSGGADSMALLHGLVRLAPTGARLVVAHACHDLRPCANEDQRLVVTVAARLGLECEARNLAVRADPEGLGEGVEARARRLRYEFLATVARERGARHVVVGHTADDQAETVLHRILRGTGINGLAGMRRARSLDDGVALVRPLLGLRRDLGRGFLAAEAETWREDPTNDDPAYARNFLRHELLARAERGPYPGATAALVRLAEQAAGSAASLTSAAEHLLDAHSRRLADGRLVLDASAVAGLDRQLLGHLVAALWSREGWPRRDMTARHHEAVTELIVAAGRGDHPTTAAIDLPGGMRAATSSARLVEFSREARPSSTQ